MDKLLEYVVDNRGVATLRLNRPQIHNAFNAELVAALAEHFDRAASTGVRALVLTGAGHSFSAGADLNWMHSMTAASEAENREDARQLAAMLRKLDELPCPTIARVNGHAFGGGVGLIACCDLSVALDTARFGLTEVRLGLAPATISPFVMARIGTAQARRYMLTGERFDATAAAGMGLVNTVVQPGELDPQVERWLEQLVAGGPEAQRATKALIRMVGHEPLTQEALDAQTSALIASLRVSAEGQEGLSAFLEKRLPAWSEPSSS